MDPGCQPGLSLHMVPPEGCWLHRVVQRQRGGRAEVTRPQEAFVGDSLNVTSQFIHQRKSQALPSLGVLEKEIVLPDEKSNNSHCEGDGGIYGYFHNLS